MQTPGEPAGPLPRLPPRTHRRFSESEAKGAFPLRLWISTEIIAPPDEDCQPERCEFPGKQTSFGSMNAPGPAGRP